MEIKYSEITQLTLTDVPGYAPIKVILNEFPDDGRRRAFFTILYRSQTWTADCGGAGKSLQQFIGSENTDYLIKHLAPYLHSSDPGPEYRHLEGICNALKEALRTPPPRITVMRSAISHPAPLNKAEHEELEAYREAAKNPLAWLIRSNVATTSKTVGNLQNGRPLYALPEIPSHD
ncbi:hypothetical protein PC510_003843 [Escherichia coli]|uniref:hypothetical protein n=1 Tax=Escherichia coli TaxID=562 RepID=UPI000A18833B|nr:hypothetical protein [Escherichia coli]EKI3096566.1 hypothetical protein [Escherichia coli]MBB9841065.1 hypothetical protein [Escherichia coli]MBS9328491.1 hypothetical protein [Escherichia coli]OSK33780.1 hypothetical protein EAHG_05020 [Escherichia coli B671]